MKMQFGKEGRRFFFLTFCVRGRDPLLSRIVANNDRGTALPEPPAAAGVRGCNPRLLSSTNL